MRGLKVLLIASAFLCLLLAGNIYAQVDEDNPAIDSESVDIPGGDEGDVEAEEEGEETEEVKLRGIVESVDGDRITIRGREIPIGDEVEIVDDDDNPISLDEISGLPVEVEAVRLPDGTLKVLEVEVKRERKQWDILRVREIQLEGFIESIEGDVITISGRGFRSFSREVVVGGDTQILGRDDSPITLDDLRVGVKVRVKAQLQSDGSLLVLKAKVKKLRGVEVHTFGFVKGFDDNTIIIGGRSSDLINRRFTIGENVEVLDKNNFPIKLSALPVGAKVKLKSQLLRGGNFIVFRIKIEKWREKKEEEGKEIKVRGIVESVDGDRITIRGREIPIGDEVEIVDDDDNPISLDEISGLPVEVEAVRLPDGTLKVLEVEVKRERKQWDILRVREIQLEGFIESIEGDVITISGRGFRSFSREVVVDGDAQILDSHNSPITLDDLRVGVKVRVKAQLQSDGSLLVLKAKVKKLRGRVHSGKPVSPEANPLTTWGRIKSQYR